VDAVVDCGTVPDDVDQNLGKPGFVGTTSRGGFSPNSSLADARQRWLFRMVRGQIEMLRDNALGNFRDSLVNTAKDTAMLAFV
jgi:hypothetical protein